MNIPEFNAEASLYHTNNHYRLAGGSFLSNGNTTVTPQACHWYFEAPICAGVIAGGTAVCLASCLAGAEAGPLGGIPCALCWTGFLGASYGFCRDCIPEWMRALIDAVSGGSGGDGGGGGFSGCCEPGKTCECGGTCKMVNGKLKCVDGICLTKLQKCP
jgi:hypothetical protein